MNDGFDARVLTEPPRRTELPSYEDDSGYIDSIGWGGDWIDAQHVCWRKVSSDYKPL